MVGCQARAAWSRGDGVLSVIFALSTLSLSLSLSLYIYIYINSLSHRILLHHSGHWHYPFSSQHSTAIMGSLYSTVETMKALKVVPKPGAEKEGIVELHDVPKPTRNLMESTPDTVLTRVRTVALNPTDWKHLKVWPKFGAVSGCEYAGDIIAVRKDETKWKVGDRIVGFGHGCNHLNPERGCFSEYYHQFTFPLIKLPDSISYDEGATLGVSLHTAGLGLFREHDSLLLPFPDTPTQNPVAVLISGGATATGLGAIQVLKLSGQKVITTCSPKNFELVKSYGAEVVFDYNDPDVISKIKSATNNNLQHVFDCVSSQTSIAMCLKAFSSEGGTFINLVPGADLSFFPANIKIHSPLAYCVLGQDYLFRGGIRKRDERDVQFSLKWADMVSKFLAEGKIKPLLPRVLPGGLAGVQEGFDLMRAGNYSAEKFIARVQDTPGLVRH